MTRNPLQIALLFLVSSVQQVLGQSVDYQDFFREVQISAVFPDSKTFPDCLPKYPLNEILRKYKSDRNKPDFDLKQFVLTNYELPHAFASGFKTDTSLSVQQHINKLWTVLTRQPEKPATGSSLLFLPKPYVVPGGRFGEVYYWDSYFTMLGLQVSGRDDLVADMLDNFAHLIDTVGFIPNGNRSYYLSRSQPPFFAMMVRLHAEKQGERIFLKYLPQLEKEYQFWMNGAEKLTSKNVAYRRVVRLPDGEIMNRYWDDAAMPRAESYKEDVKNAQAYAGKPEDFYRNIRAACESGWDFSSRWFRDGKTLATIHTTELIPVDLNSLLCHLELTLSEAHTLAKNPDKAQIYKELAEKRRKAIFKYGWDKEAKFFTDYDFVAKKQKTSYSLAGMYPFFLDLKIGMPEPVAARLEKDFLKSGGLVSTTATTGQQWDAPNGWAPLQWITYKGLKNNGFDKLALQIKQRWTETNVRVYKEAGKMVEKYNVTEAHLKAGGGEYALQDGFGWTNGVLLKMTE
jgi:alpha,alpha-trehalase